MKFNQTSEEDFVILGLHDSDNVLSGSEGLRLAILPHDLSSSRDVNSENIPSEFDGYNVSSRSLASFAVRPRRVNRASEPHGRCSKVNPMMNERYLRETDNNSRYVIADCH